MIFWQHYQAVNNNSHHGNNRWIRGTGHLIGSKSRSVKEELACLSILIIHLIFFDLFKLWIDKKNVQNQMLMLLLKKIIWSYDQPYEFLSLVRSRKGKEDFDVISDNTYTEQICVILVAC